MSRGIVIAVSLGECWTCHEKIAGESAAIGRIQDRLWYVPFVEDLRTSSALLAHPVCFATEHGVDALETLVHDNDYRTAEQQRRP